jgi:hypothetical protein
MCLPSLWSYLLLRQPLNIHIRNYPPLYVFLFFGACDGLHHHQPPDSIHNPHPKRSTTLCLSSLWSLRRAAPRPPPDIIHIRKDPPLYVFLLFGACDGLCHAHLPKLSTSGTIHYSMSSLSLELATGCATHTSRHYPHSNRFTILCISCISSLWCLRQATPHQPPNIIQI